MFPENKIERVELYQPVAVHHVPSAFPNPLSLIFICQMLVNLVSICTAHRAIEQGTSNNVGSGVYPAASEGCCESLPFKPPIKWLHGASPLLSRCFWISISLSLGTLSSSLPHLNPVSTRFIHGFCFVVRQSHTVAHAGLELTVQLRQALYSWQLSCQVLG